MPLKSRTAIAEQGLGLELNKMQNYYGNAIRSNKGNLEGMKTSIQAILKHMVQDDILSLEDQHSLCPKETSTWCKFWKEKLYKTATYSGKNRLPSVFRNLVQPLFDRLSADDLLLRCLMGKTQNQNEALHGTLWKICPKTIFCGKRRINIATCQAFSKFNAGQSGISLENVMCCLVSMLLKHSEVLMLSDCMIVW
eukprot:gene1640-1818_t